RAGDHPHDSRAARRPLSVRLRPEDAGADFRGRAVEMTTTTSATTTAINTPAAELLFELIDGPADPKATWIVSNEPACGILGTLRRFSAEQASRAPALGHKTPAAHAAHLLFALELATQ